MGDFPPQWNWVRDLSEGGQAHTFVVRWADGSDSKEYVLKRLKNPDRRGYFEREIKACEALDHPNVLKILEHGRTPKDRLYLISEYCVDGALQKSRPQLERAGDGLKFFRQIVAGVAHAHSRPNPIYHLDLKPANIFLKGGLPVVGDFGICFIAESELTFTEEGPRGSLYYCAPELRNPKVEAKTPSAADVYSLGKILYWLFTGDVYDGHEEDYSKEEQRQLARLFPSDPQFAFVDELINESVRRDPNQRLTTAGDFEHRIGEILERIEAGGRVLDHRLSQRCLFCGKGHYRAVAMPPTVDIRTAPMRVLASHRPSIWAEMRSQTINILGQAFAGIGGDSAVPLNLMCDYCGNVQTFRWDRVQQAQKNWQP